MNDVGRAAGGADTVGGACERARGRVQHEHGAEQGTEGAALQRAQDPTRLIMIAPTIPRIRLGIHAAR